MLSTSACAASFERTVYACVFGLLTCRLASAAYQKPQECMDFKSENPECNFGQFFAYEGTSNSLQIKGVTVSDPDLHETCPESFKECVRMDVAVRAFKGSVGLNTRSNLNLYFDARQGSGFTAYLVDLNSAIKVLFYKVETENLLGRPQSTVLYYNTQNSGNEEFVSVVVSDQGFTGAARTAVASSIRIDVVIVAVNDPPIVKCAVPEFSPTEDVLGSLRGISIEDIDLSEKITSSLASRNWMGKASNSVYLNMMRVRASVTYGVLKLGYTRNLELMYTADKMYMTISPLLFGHDVCRVSEAIENSALLSVQLPSKGPGGAPASVSPYQQLCAYDNVGGTSCPTGGEPECKCFKNGKCDSVNGKIVLHLNRSRPILAFRDALTALLDSSDRTCGGMPIYPKPNNFTTGRKCQDDQVCSDEELPKCVPGVTCACCANVSFICSSNLDCSTLDSGSLCGCVKGGDGTCGPYWRKSEGPNGALTTDLIGNNKEEYDGIRCTYTGPGSGACMSAAFASEGTNLAFLVSTVALSSLGTKELQFFGNIIDVNRALESLSYVTNPDYNRFYRVPLEERNPFTFNIQADSLDTLVLEANDFGNSGGGPRDQQSMTIRVPIRVQAENDRPTAVGPNRVVAFEDVPFHFTDGKLHPIRGPRLRVADPDYKDYGFETRVLTVNLSCTHGRLFLNEAFLRSKRIDNRNPNRPQEYQVGMAQADPEVHGDHRPGVVFKIWDSGQELRGLTYVDYDTQGGKFFGTKYIRYGNGCQFKPQCADGGNMRSEDTEFGFFTTPWYGVVYPLADQTLRNAISCGLCADEVGNKFISMSGTFADLNKALETVTYLPDPHFNTRYGIKEYLTFSVNDGGAFGNDNSALPLSHTHVIEVIVDSVNDRPIVGRRVVSKRPIKYWDGGVTQDKLVDDLAVLPFNKTLDSACLRHPPAGSDYTANCHAKVREFIDVDEDTLFYITPSILWIHDADAQEAVGMPALRRYCCDQAGEEACTCGRTCRCGASACKCNIPDVCYGGAGQLLISFEVQNGLLSFSPPPGRNAFDVEELEFLQNLTLTDMSNRGQMERCPIQKRCSQNVTRLQIRTTIATLQSGLEKMFLTYLPKPNFYGRDKLKIYVNDQGYTDECYNQSLGKREELNIRVVSVNDPPVITTSDLVLSYPKGQKCYFDYQQFYTSIPVGHNPDCIMFANESTVPPSRAGSPWRFDDVDMDGTPFGNMTLIIQIGARSPDHSYAGSFMLKNTIFSSTFWYEEYRHEGLLRMVIHGTMAEINSLMDFLSYNADDKYLGYAPFRIIAMDNFNFGECSGHHTCGQGKAVCMDPLEADAHATPIMGMTSKFVDVTIGAAIGCASTVALYGSKQVACEKCRSQAGCGWCPTACPSQGGKCMIASGGGPQFETCFPPTVSGELDGAAADPWATRGWNECEEPQSILLTIAGAAAGAGFALMVFGYIFYRWLKRRHGSALAYGRAKRYTFKVLLRQVNLLPPESAQYFPFFTLAGIAIGLRVGISVSDEISNFEPVCNFDRNFFLDKSNRIEMVLDNCKVNFVPVNEQPPPDDKLDAVKVKMSITNDPEIIVETSTCDLKATFNIHNKKPESVRYLRYWCTVQVLVPLGGFVMPQIKMTARGDNVTTIFSEPTEKTPNFKLDFGPNDLILDGIRMVAFLNNVAAKNFRFDVEHGRLTMIGLTVLGEANLKSVTADMIVTSPQRSSVKFWQKEANKVCLTAPKGSLYVENSCQKVCRMRDTTGKLIVDTASRRSSTFDYSLRRQGGGDEGWEAATVRRADTSEDVGVLANSSRAWIHGRLQPSFRPKNVPGNDSFVSTRVLGANITVVHQLTVTDPVAGDNRTPFVCTGNPVIDAEWTCFPYDAVQERLKEKCPPGASYAYRKDVPQIPGCTDLEFCMLTGSSQCLCKPGCDMQRLNPPGVCNVGGQCCQIICEGYSSADMLPEENQPRCPQTAEQPWCNGTLDQKFRFLSDKGQISFQVGCCSDKSYGECTTCGIENPKPVSRVHSYQGANPLPAVSIPTDLMEEDKMVLSEIFHPGGANRPKEEWFSFSLYGPGAPEARHGRFVWVSAVRHLIFDAWFMDVVSYGLLSPPMKAASGNFNPGFCPAWVNYSKPEFYDRLKVMYRAVLDTLQLYPPGQKEKILPVGTLLVYYPSAGDPIWFGVDPRSNQPILGLVKIADHPLLLYLLYLGIGIPIAAAIGGVLFIRSKWLAHLQEYRRVRLLQEQTMRMLSLVMAGRGPDPEDVEMVPKEFVEEMVGRTSLWYVIEEFIGNAEESRTAPQQLFVTISEVVFGLAPAFFVYLLNDILKKSFGAYRCKESSNFCECRTQIVEYLVFAEAVDTLLNIYYSAYLIDLGWYYLDVSYNLFRRILRHVVYLFMAIAIFFSIFGFTIVLLFVVLGIVVKPTLAAPYAIMIGGSALVTLLLVVKLLKFQARVSRAVTKNVLLYKSKVAHAVPKAVLDAVMGNNVKQVLQANGLSIPAIVKAVVIFVGCMTAIFFFLFTGFQAFTDSTDITSSLINDLILLMTVVASYFIVVADGDANEMGYR